LRDKYILGKRRKGLCVSAIVCWGSGMLRMVYGCSRACISLTPYASLTISDGMGHVGNLLQGNCVTAVKVWFDGASRNNGSADTATSAGFGVCAVDPPSGRVVFGGYGYLGSVSNNVAEFTAFAAACQWVAESDLPSATVLGDSELVTDAFHGRKTLRLPALRHLMVIAKAWLAQAGAVCVEHVPRHENERADALANTAVDQPCSNMLLRDPLDWVVPPSCPPDWAYFESDDPALPPKMEGTRSVTKALAEMEACRARRI
jgi:ribonuclease HI